MVGTPATSRGRWCDNAFGTIGPVESREDVYSFSQLSYSKRVYPYKRFDGESRIVT